MLRAQELRKLSNLEGLNRYTFDRFVPQGHGLNPEKRRNLQRAFDLAREFALQPKGWLTLIGGYGCGKTHLAAAIANERIAHSQPALFVNVPDLLDHLRATYSPTSSVTYDERFEIVRNAPLLILDDLGTENATPWASEKLYHFHICANDRGAPGTGTISWDEIAKALKKINYDHYLSVEACDISTLDPELAKLAAVWRSYGQGPDQIARDSLAFMKKMMG